MPMTCWISMTVADALATRISTTACIGLSDWTVTNTGDHRPGRNAPSNPAFTSRYTLADRADGRIASRQNARAQSRNDRLSGFGKQGGRCRWLITLPRRPANLGDHPTAFGRTMNTLTPFG